MRHFCVLVRNAFKSDFHPDCTNCDCEHHSGTENGTASWVKRLNLCKHLSSNPQRPAYSGKRTSNPFPGSPRTMRKRCYRRAANTCLHQVYRRYAEPRVISSRTLFARPVVPGSRFAAESATVNAAVARSTCEISCPSLARPRTTICSAC